MFSNPIESSFILRTNSILFIKIFHSYIFDKEFIFKDFHLTIIKAIENLVYDNGDDDDNNNNNNSISFRIRDSNYGEKYSDKFPNKDIRDIRNQFHKEDKGNNYINKFSQKKQILKNIIEQHNNSKNKEQNQNQSNYYIDNRLNTNSKLTIIIPSASLKVKQSIISLHSSNLYL